MSWQVKLSSAIAKDFGEPTTRFLHEYWLFRRQMLVVNGTTEGKQLRVTFSAQIEKQGKIWM